MNWLAHLFLAEPNVESRLGNILADIVKGSNRLSLNYHIQQGIKCHQLIDIFTDSHLIVARSKQRIHPNYRRFAGILVDVFYDHFLAKNWSTYASVPLEQFTHEIYESFQAYPGKLPVNVTQIITQIATEDWLGSYRYVTGVENTLLRITKKLAWRSKCVLLNQAVSELTLHYDEFDNDFQAFFPELVEFSLGAMRTATLTEFKIQNPEIRSQESFTTTQLYSRRRRFTARCFTIYCLHFW